MKTYMYMHILTQSSGTPEAQVTAELYGGPIPILSALSYALTTIIITRCVRAGRDVRIDQG